MMSRHSSRIVLTALAVLLLSVPASGWTGRRPLSLGGGEVEEPRILVSEGLVHVFWRASDPSESIYWDLRYTRSADGGRTWSDPIPLVQSDATSIIQVDVAVSGLDVHVVWVKIRPFDKIFYKRSIDGGLTWGTKKRLSDRDGSVNRFPQVAASGDAVYVLWETARSNSHKHKSVLRRSSNGGAHWGPRQTLRFIGFWPRIAADGNRVHVVYRADDVTYHRASADRGDTWLRRTPVPTTESAFPDSLVLAGESVHLASMELGYKAAWIWYLRSPDRGESWMDVRRMHRRKLYGGGATLAALGNEIHLTWHEGWNPGPGRTFYRRSSDGGHTWQDREKLAGRFSREAPSIAVAADGVAHVVFAGDGEVFYRRSR